MNSSSTASANQELGKFKLPSMNHMFQDNKIQHPVPRHNTEKSLVSPLAIINGNSPQFQTHSSNYTYSQNNLSEHQIPTPPPHVLQSPNKFRLPGMSQIFQHDNKSNPNLMSSDIQQPMPVHQQNILNHTHSIVQATSSTQNYAYYCSPFDQQIPTPPPHYRMNSSPVLLMHSGMNNQQLYYGSSSNLSIEQQQQQYYQQQQQMFQYGIQTPGPNSNTPIETTTRKKLSKQATAWTPREDKLLRHLKEVKSYGWREVSTHFCDRTPNACQFRWRRIVSGMAVKAPVSVKEPVKGSKSQSIKSLLN